MKIPLSFLAGAMGSPLERGTGCVCKPCCETNHDLYIADTPLLPSQEGIRKWPSLFNRPKYVLTLLIAVLFGSTLASAQDKIHGTVKDSTGKAVWFAIVSLKKKASNAIVSY